MGQPRLQRRHTRRLTEPFNAVNKCSPRPTGGDHAPLVARPSRPSSRRRWTIVLYLANASSEKIRDAMRAGRIGMMTTPNEGRAPLPGVRWAADNGCFSTRYVGDTRWIAWLRRHTEHAPRCLFATAPDVVGDAAATLARSTPWLPVIRELGYPAALVAQDGLEDLTIPWDTFDVLFIGGSTTWKLSPAAAEIAAQARRRGKPVHMGRVNSRRRWTYAEHIGCDSADGTFLAFGPDTNLARLGTWLDQPSLFTDHAAPPATSANTSTPLRAPLDSHLLRGRVISGAPALPGGCERDPSPANAVDK